jgi:hypothetical protein
MALKVKGSAGGGMAARNVWVEPGAHKPYTFVHAESLQASVPPPCRKGISWEYDEASAIFKLK